MRGRGFVVIGQGNDAEAIRPGLLFAVRDGVALVTIDRPSARNALNLEIVRGLADAAGRVKDDPTIGAVVVTGSGTHFSAGADISAARSVEVEAGARQFIREFQTGFRLFTGVPKPVVAAVEGFALGGGCELALWCDLRVLSETAVLGVPEIKIGALPAAGGTQLLPRLLGRGMALEMLLTGESITADRALALGLTSRVVPAGLALESALQLASKLAAMPPLAVAAMKRAVEAAWLPLDQAMEVELRLGAELFATEDRREGMTAFLEKRSPMFHGR